MAESKSHLTINYDVEHHWVNAETLLKSLHEIVNLISALIRGHPSKGTVSSGIFVHYEKLGIYFLPIGSSVKAFAGIITSFTIAGFSFLCCVSESSLHRTPIWIKAPDKALFLLTGPFPPGCVKNLSHFPE